MKHIDQDHARGLQYVGGSGSGWATRVDPRSGGGGDCEDGSGCLGGSRAGERGGRVRHARAAVGRQPGGRRAAEDVRRVLLAPGKAQNLPARAKQARRVSAARAAATAAAACPAAGASLPPSWAACGALAGRAGAGAGRGCGRAFSHARNRPSERRHRLPKARGRGGRVRGSRGQRVRGRWACGGRRGARCGARAGRERLA